MKAAPNLRKGWRFVAPDEAGLESALDRLYPGAMADWGAAESGHPPVTHYRAFTNRQTGLYRVTQALTEEQAAQVIRAGCHVRFCLKRRWWTVEGLAPDAAGEKSLIPCLEPCAVLLELARQAFRIEQAERVPWNVPGEDLATVRAALVVALAHPDLSIREGDVGAPGHPRRIQLALEKLAALETSGGDAEGKAPSK